MTNKRIKAWVRPEIQALAAYHVPPAEGYIKLDAMENPYGWPDDLTQEWSAGLRDVALNRYPDPEASDLKVRLREYFELPSDQVMLLGNGSDELIQLIAMAVAEPGRAVLAAEPGFVMYRAIAQALGLRYVGVLLRASNFALDANAMLRAIEEYQPALVFLACPNNPTGNLFKRQDIDAIAAASPGLVVIDEAYHAFCGESFIDLLAQHDHVVIMRTLSKLGLAALRIGLLIGNEAWLEELNKIRLPYNLNTLSQFTAGFILQHKAVLNEQAARIRRDREQLFQSLQQFQGVQVWPSRANFLLFRVPGATKVYARLKTENILIKSLTAGHPLLADCLRVTVGTEPENAAFLDALGLALTEA